MFSSAIPGVVPPNKGASASPHRVDWPADLHRFGKARPHGLLQLVGRHVREHALEGADEHAPDLIAVAQVDARRWVSALQPM
jgi:hypothetical protein